MITCTFENGKQVYLRHVVVHALVEKDGNLLLVKRSPKISEGGKWSLPSGFMDRDETASQAVLRELREETGWEGEVESLFFIKTDPNRPREDRQNVSFHFVVKPIRQTGESDWESTEITWMPMSKLPPEDMVAFDHKEAITHYLRFRTQPFPLPLFV